MAGIKLIVGLGNPGAQYEATRHNAGFWWVDQAAERHGASLRLDARYKGLAAKADIGGAAVWLLEPQTFMNASGESVQPLAAFFRIAPEEILVVHDEMDLPAGDVRLKQGGGHGGHNGLRDIQTRLGSNNFWRLRVGVGHPGDREKVLGFVLGMPTRSEAALIGEAIERSLPFLPQIVAGDLQNAMQKLHTRPKPARNEPKKEST